MPAPFRCFACLILLTLAAPAVGDDDKKLKATPTEAKTAEPSKVADKKAADESTGTENSQKPDEEVIAGHSYHGEAFNEGARQAAYLVDGVGKVDFPITASNEKAQAFFNQGVAQLHGFWYLEAERSFRQVAAIDPECAMAYWGMSLANKNNSKRAKAFAEEATKRKDNANEHEKMYIDALAEYHKADTGKSKARGEKYLKALEKIVYKYPDDIEAKAMIVLQMWFNRRSQSPIGSFLAVNALIEQVLEAEPMHPIHHYRIHLWDYENPDMAVVSAIKCGQAAPGIAHMWHMPGHIFSRLKRYNDAAWQQEASARVDHAHT